MTFSLFLAFALISSVCCLNVIPLRRFSDRVGTAAFSYHLLAIICAPTFIFPTFSISISYSYPKYDCCICLNIYAWYLICKSYLIIEIPIFLSLFAHACRKIVHRHSKLGNLMNFLKLQTCKQIMVNGIAILRKYKIKNNQICCSYMNIRKVTKIIYNFVINFINFFSIKLK